jgi:putative transposase
VYNRTLALRKDAWENERRRVGYFETKRLIPIWKKEYPDLKDVHSQVLQDVSTRVDLAYKAFFRRVKLGEEEPGHPRFKGYGRYDSITYTQSAAFGLKSDPAFDMCKRGILTLSKIGDVPIVTHRKLPEGCKVKICTIRRTHTGKWLASIVVDTGKPEINLSKTPNSYNSPIGIDLGITNFITFSSGDPIQNPRFFKIDESKLARAQRKLSNEPKCTLKRRKSVMIVSKTHERIANKRKDFAHKISLDLVREYDLIVFEDLNIKGMIESDQENYKNLSKSIHDVAWNQLVRFTQFKAGDAGSRVVLVDPRNTSRTCSCCGYVDAGNRVTQEKFKCLKCGHSMNADVNAAINILRLGKQSLEKS